MPGAPPTSTREPFTAPPPKTLSSSPIPVENLSSASVSSSEISFGFLKDTLEEPPLVAPLPFTSAFTSTRLSHAPQAVHLPLHLTVSLPHSEQQNTVFCFIFPPMPEADC